MSKTGASHKTVKDSPVTVTLKSTTAFHHSKIATGRRACSILDQIMEGKSEDANLQPLVEGWSCSELTRLKALELLGGEGL